MSVVMGNGCGSVGKAIASDTGGSRFESSHRQFLKNIHLRYLKDENKLKEAGNGQIKKY